MSSKVSDLKQDFFKPIQNNLQFKLLPVSNGKPFPEPFVIKKNERNCIICSLGVPITNEPKVAIRIFDENDNQWKYWSVTVKIIEKLEETLGREWKASDHIVIKKNLQ